MQRETRDGSDHIHKSHLFGNYRNSMDQALAREMLKLERAHDEVYKLVDAIFNLHDITRITHARYNKGLLRDEGDSSAEQTNDPETGLEGIPLHPRELRMLRYAKIEHQVHSEKQSPEEKFIKIVAAPVLHYRKRPESPFVIDTLDLSVESDFGKFHFSRGEKVTRLDADLWKAYVRPFIYFRDDLDLRPYDRKVLEE